MTVLRERRWSAGDFWLAGGVFALAVALRMLFLDAPPSPDAAAYALVVRHGGLYSTFPFDRPQGIFWLFTAAMRLFGDSVTGFRVGAALWVAATSVLLGWTTRPVLGCAGGWLAAALFAVLSTTASVEGFSANAETWVNLPLVLSAAAIWAGQWKRAGFWIGLAAFIKPVGAGQFVLLFAWAARRREAREALTSLWTFAVWPAFSMLAGAAADWQGYWYSLVSQRLLVDSGMTAPPTLQIGRFIYGALRAAPALLLPLALGVLPRATLPSDERTSSAEIRWFASLWILSSVAGGLIGSKWYPHYFITFVPPLAILGAFGIMALADLRRIRPGVAIVVVLACALLPLDAKWWRGDRQWQDYWWREGRVAALDTVASKIQQLTLPSESIYIAFSEVEDYFVAERAPAVPEQLFLMQLVSVPSVQDTVISRLRTRRPALVVIVDSVALRLQRRDFANRFKRALEAEYIFCAERAGRSFWLRRSLAPGRACDEPVRVTDAGQRQPKITVCQLCQQATRVRTPDPPPDITGRAG